MTKRKINRRNLLAPDVGDLRAWKLAVSKRIWEFVRTHFPAKHKVTGHNFWIDSDSLVNGLILEGYAFPAAEVKGFSAPVDKRTLTRKHPFYTSEYGWRMTDNRAMTGALGVWQRPTEYWGGRTLDASLGFFGVTKDGVARAYGLDAEGALPVYSYDVAQWLATEQIEEVHRIMDEVWAETLNFESVSA